MVITPINRIGRKTGLDGGQIDRVVGNRSMEGDIATIPFLRQYHNVFIFRRKNDALPLKGFEVLGGH